MTMSDEEAKVQIALGTYDPSRLIDIARSCRNHELITVAIKMLAKMLMEKDASIFKVGVAVAGDSIHGNHAQEGLRNLVHAFVQNTYISDRYKIYLITAEQLLDLNTHYSMNNPESSFYYDIAKKPLVTELKCLHYQLFLDM